MQINNQDNFETNCLSAEIAANDLNLAQFVANEFLNLFLKL